MTIAAGAPHTGSMRQACVLHAGSPCACCTVLCQAARCNLLLGRAPGQHCRRCRHTLRRQVINAIDSTGGWPGVQACSAARRAGLHGQGPRIRGRCLRVRAPRSALHACTCGHLHVPSCMQARQLRGAWGCATQHMERCAAVKWAPATNRPWASAFASASSSGAGLRRLSCGTLSKRPPELGQQPGMCATKPLTPRLLFTLGAVQAWRQP